MEWTRSDTIAIAKDTCTRCHGLGLRLGRNGELEPCHCVLREVFRACYAHFQLCTTKEKYLSRISLEIRPGGGRTNIWGRKDEEFIADFILVSKRTLSEDDYRVFKYHFLLGADWKLCCRKLQIARGNFFHAVYRIERQLGRVFRELEPYSLFPIDQYYGGGRRDNAQLPALESKPVTELKRRPRIIVPLSRPA